jgi:hypothetical protein
VGEQPVQSLGSPGVMGNHSRQPFRKNRLSQESVSPKNLLM